MFDKVLLKTLCELICYALPTVERRINLYINHKVFQEPAYHLLPEWPDTSEIVDEEAKCLLNPMISPSRRDNLSFRVFDTANCGFDFRRFGRQPVYVSFTAEVVQQTVSASGQDQRSLFEERHRREVYQRGGVPN